MNSLVETARKQKTELKQKSDKIAQMVSEECKWYWEDSILLNIIGIWTDDALFALQESSIKELRDTNKKTIFDLQNAIKEKTAQIDILENDLKETEHLRNTIISLVQPKRKKWQ